MTVHAPGRYERLLTGAFAGSALLLVIYVAYGLVLIPPAIHTPDRVALATECCPWDAEVLAWVDRNEDGVRQMDEPPLGGVPVRAAGFFGTERCVTDPKGRAAFHIPGRCSGSEERSLVAEAPAGYRPTTPLVSPPGGRRTFGFKSTVE